MIIFEMCNVVQCTTRIVVQSKSTKHRTIGFQNRMIVWVTIELVLRPSCNVGNLWFRLRGDKVVCHFTSMFRDVVVLHWPSHELQKLKIKFLRSWREYSSMHYILNCYSQCVRVNVSVHKFKRIYNAKSILVHDRLNIENFDFPYLCSMSISTCARNLRIMYLFCRSFQYANVARNS